MNNSFLALDVETANADYSSICQIGIVEFEDGEIINKWCTLINPEAYFDSFNVSIHGIKESDVKNAPTFDKIYCELTDRLVDRITVHHMPFDRIAVNRACQEYQLKLINTRWLDSAKIARRTWEQFAYRGYSLKNLADFMQINFKHHDALQDAMAAGLIVAKACCIKEMSIEDWFTHTNRPIFHGEHGTYYSPKIKQEGNPEGSLHGENLVFTGTLSLPRQEAAAIAANIGCNVSDSVNQKTTILVVGTQDTSKLSGYSKSSKHRKAEELIAGGKEIKILSEKDFIEMCNNEDSSLNIPIPLIVPNKIGPSETHKSQRITATVNLEINLSEKIIEKAHEIFNSYSDEQKISIRKRIREQISSSIKDCNHNEKRILGNEFQIRLEAVENSYDK